MNKTTKGKQNKIQSIKKSEQRLKNALDEYKGKIDLSDFEYSVTPVDTNKEDTTVEPTKKNETKPKSENQDNSKNYDRIKPSMEKEKDIIPEKVNRRKF